MLVASTIAIACKSPEDPHLKRAKELLTIKEWGEARTELKLALKDQPKGVEERALLLYCITHANGEKQSDVTAEDLFFVFIIRAENSAAFMDLPSDEREKLSTMVTEFRRTLYDKGVDSQDAADLEQVIDAAARFGFDNSTDDEDERKDIFASVLAAANDEVAISYLGNRLKQSHPDRIVEDFVGIGEPALSILRRLVSDPEFLGRTAALEAIRKIEFSVARAAFASAHRGTYDNDGLGSNTLGHSDSFGLLDVRRIHAHWIEFGASRDAVAVFQTRDPQTSEMFVEIDRLGNGFTPLNVRKDGKPFVLGGASGVFGVTRAGDDELELHRVRSHDDMQETAGGRLVNPAIGQRVKVTGYAPFGTIARADDSGLWIVHLDQPIEGMRDLSVPASSLVAVENKTVTRQEVETIVGKIQDDELRIDVDTFAAAR